MYQGPKALASRYNCLKEKIEFHLYLFKSTKCTELDEHFKHVLFAWDNFDRKYNLISAFFYDKCIIYHARIFDCLYKKRDIDFDRAGLRNEIIDAFELCDMSSATQLLKNEIVSMNLAITTIAATNNAIQALSETLEALNHNKKLKELEVRNEQLLLDTLLKEYDNQNERIKENFQTALDILQIHHKIWFAQCYPTLDTSAVEMSFWEASCEIPSVTDVTRLGKSATLEELCAAQRFLVVFCAEKSGTIPNDTDIALVWKLIEIFECNMGQGSEMSRFLESACEISDCSTKHAAIVEEIQSKVILIEKQKEGYLQLLESIKELFHELQSVKLVRCGLDENTSLLLAEIITEIITVFTEISSCTAQLRTLTAIDVCFNDKMLLQTFDRLVGIALLRENKSCIKFLEKWLEQREALENQLICWKTSEFTSVISIDDI